MKNFGKFVLFMGRLISNRETFRVYLRLFFEECEMVGLNSLTLVVITSTFIGAVTAVQTTYNLTNPFIPVSLVGSMVRDMTILELAPTITAIVFAGKVGSNISGQLGTMRITEQIDALEVMGINSASYLVLPKILASIAMLPLLVIMAGFLSIFGGYLAGVMSGLFSADDYVYGIRNGFNEFNVTFALIKAFVFGFLVSAISSYKGFYTQGGALEVGISGTQAVTNSCIAILLADYLLARMLV